MTQQVESAQERQPEPTEDQEQDEFCGKCGGVYEAETEEEELWIACDVCTKWFHAICIGVNCDSVPENFICHDCK